MRTASSALLTVSLVVTTACSDGLPTSTTAGLLGTWGSSTASLAVSDTSAVLEVLSSGTCFGSYGDIAQPMASPTFAVSGSYTQLMGAYPGKVQYAARFSGVMQGDRLSLTVTVPALQQTLGPFVLTRGVSNAWTQCLFP